MDIRRFFRKRSSPESASATPQQPDATVISTTRTRDTFSADQPIHTQAEDRFNRSPFAEQVAATVALRKEVSSLVIGIYGPWGDGKTSVLNLMEGALRRDASIVPIRFNPWYFQSQEQLIRGFFATVADGLGRSLPSRTAELGSLLERYGFLVSLASVTVAGIVQLNPGQAVQDLGKRLSTVELETLRVRLETILQESGKRAIILVDDIDRLDRPEIQSIFKLIKLSAGFERTAYVLAFDDDIVADSLGEKYGAGGSEAGRAFLEKIVQVPLHLPPAERLALRQLAFEGVDAALNASGIVLSEDDVQAFGRHFVDGLEPRLQTPRQAKRYANAVSFALPLLKGEVHPVDQLLVEGIRVFYPRLYSIIRDNPDVFVPPASSVDNPALKERTQHVLQEGVVGLGAREQKSLQELLQVLFPRLKGVLGNMHYGSDWDARWAKEKRIRSDQYFSRYFQYSVPPRDIADSTVTTLISTAAGGDISGLAVQLSAVAQKGALPRLIEKLRAQEDVIEEAAAFTLALAVATNTELLPREKGVFSSIASTFAQAAVFVAKLVRRATSADKREGAARQIVSVAPIPFALECFRWFRVDKEDEEQRIVSTAVEKELGQTLATRIADGTTAQRPYAAYPQDVATVFWVWHMYGTAGAVAAYLTTTFATNPAEVPRFLASFVGEMWGMESGLSRKADFGRESYDLIASLISPDILLEHLKTLYGQAVITPSAYHQSDDVSLEEQASRQFAFIHQKVVAEKSAATVASPPKPEDQRS
jgi:KAP family P-loop domain